jgi:hypothetical protein
LTSSHVWLTSLLARCVNQEFAFADFVGYQVGFVKKASLTFAQEYIDKSVEKGLSYNIAYSVESSTYFAIQVYANYWGFKKSNQRPGTGYTRYRARHSPVPTCVAGCFPPRRWMTLATLFPPSRCVVISAALTLWPGPARPVRAPLFALQQAHRDRRVAAEPAGSDGGRTAKQLASGPHPRAR